MLAFTPQRQNKSEVVDATPLINCTINRCRQMRDLNPRAIDWRAVLGTATFDRSVNLANRFYQIKNSRFLICNWIVWDSNPELPGYEPGFLTN